MDNFNSNTNGYDKQQVNDFIDFVIKRTEHNVITIKNQQDEIKRLQQEVERLKTVEYNMNFVNFNNEKLINELKDVARKEADLIVSEAKNNANKIINEALIKSEKVEILKQTTEANIKECKRKLRNNLLQQLDKVEEIEFL